MAETDNTTPEQSSKGSLKTIIIVAAVLLIEGATIMGTMYFSGGPSEASAGQDPSILAADKQVEVLLLEGKFDNRMAGVTYLYETEIYITTRNANKEFVEKTIEANKAAITVDVGAVFRRAEPAVFQEPTYATLSRQIKAALDQRFGKDDKNEPVVHDVLILKCIGYRAEG